MKTVKDYIQYIDSFHNGNEIEKFFIENHYKKESSIRTVEQTEVEEILDYLFSKNPKIEKVGYSTIVEKKNKRHKQLATKQSKDNEVEGVDYDVCYDFEDGYRFVKLISQSSYNREGKLMSHCVSSYFGRDSIIYSLRDKNNNPHATIEDGNQVKGKGNQTVDNKYFDYCIQFLEHLGCEMGENEMKNIGYYKLDSIDKDLTCEATHRGYVSEKDFDKIRDKDGDVYLGFGLLKVKKLVELKADFSLKFNFNVSYLISYFFKKSKNIIDRANRSHSTAVANEYSSTVVANESSSTVVANESYSTAVANESYSTAVANESYSTAVANGSHSTVVANESYSTAVANGSHSTAVANESSSTAVANRYSSTVVANGYSSTAVANGYSSTAVANGSHSTVVANESYSTAVANESYSTAVANGSHSTVVANESYSTAVANGVNSIAVCRGHDSTARGVIGSWLVLSEYDDKKEHIVSIKSVKVDGKKIKENTLYRLQGGKFIEYK